MSYESNLEELKNALALVNRSDYESAKIICLDLIFSTPKFENSIQNSTLLARSHNILAEIFLRETNYIQSYEYGLKAAKYAEDSQSYFEQSTAQYILAQYFIYQQEFFKSLEAIYLGLSFVPINDEKGLKYFGHIHLGTVYSSLRQYPKALENLLIANDYFVKVDKPQILGKIFTDIAEVYSHLSDRKKALQFLQKALELQQSIGYDRGIAFVNIQLGLHFFACKELNIALEYYSKALVYFKELNITRGIGVGYSNIADVYFELEEYEEAFTLYQLALEQFLLIYDNNFIAYLNFKIAKVYAKPEFSKYSFQNSERLFIQTVDVFKTYSTLTELKEAYFELVNLYKGTGLWKNAFEFLEYYNSIEIETTIQQSLLEIRNNEFKNMMDISEKEKAITERLLSQLLPSGIATKLLDNKDVSEQFDNVSILFADLVGYTKISDKMSPINLFKSLNYVIGLIDTIVAKNNCERLKTIGDCYMAMSGIPLKSEEHCYLLAKVALEIISELLIPKEIQDLLPPSYAVSFRIGLHCGPVSAGLIGNKRFQYDVYGDTVNVASRLEAQGEPGKIHISEAFTNSISQYPEFKLVPRGEINIKGKGNMQTYWLEKAI